MTQYPLMSAVDLTLRTDDVTRVDAVNAEIPAGSLVTIVGANGSGKSSLLDLLAGITAPTNGMITLAGQLLSSFSPRELARQRAWLGQSTPGGWDYAVREVISWGRRKTNDDAASPPTIEDLATEFGLGEFLDAPLRRLSSGERQRTHLARIWMQDAPITLLDEPDANLDECGRDHVHRSIDAKRARGHAIVIVTHDPAWAASAADHIWVMDHGVLTEQ